MPSPKIFISTRCSSRTPTQSICVPQSPLIVVFVIITIIGALILLVIFRAVLEKRRLQKQKQTPLLNHLHHQEQATETPVVPFGNRRQPCETERGQVPQGVQWTNPDPWVSRAGDGEGVGARRALAHSNSVKTIDTLPVYHERVEDDPVQVKRMEQVMSPPVSPRTVRDPKGQVSGIVGGGSV